MRCIFDVLTRLEPLQRVTREHEEAPPRLRVEAWIPRILCEPAGKQNSWNGLLGHLLKAKLRAQCLPRRNGACVLLHEAARSTARRGRAAAPPSAPPSNSSGRQLCRSCCTRNQRAIVSVRSNPQEACAQVHMHMHMQCTTGATHPERERRTTPPVARAATCRFNMMPQQELTAGLKKCVTNR